MRWSAARETMSREQLWNAVPFREVAPLGLKKHPQKFTALQFEQTSHHLYSVIEPALSWNIKDRSAGTGFGIPRSEYKPCNARLHDRSSTHGTRFQRDVERRPDEPPCPQPFSCFPDHDHFRMCCRVLGNLSIVMGDRDHFQVVHEDCPNRDFSCLWGKGSLL